MPQYDLLCGFLTFLALRPGSPEPQEGEASASLAFMHTGNTPHARRQPGAAEQLNASVHQRGGSAPRDQHGAHYDVLTAKHTDLSRVTPRAAKSPAPEARKPLSKPHPTSRAASQREEAVTRLNVVPRLNNEQAQAWILESRRDGPDSAPLNSGRDEGGPALSSRFSFPRDLSEMDTAFACDYTGVEEYWLSRMDDGRAASARGDRLLSVRSAERDVGPSQAYVRQTQIELSYLRQLVTAQQTELSVVAKTAADQASRVSSQEQAMRRLEDHVRKVESGLEQERLHVQRLQDQIARQADLLRTRSGDREVEERVFARVQRVLLNDALLGNGAAAREAGFPDDFSPEEAVVREHYYRYKKGYLAGFR